MKRVLKVKSVCSNTLTEKKVLINQIKSSPNSVIIVFVFNYNNRRQSSRLHGTDKRATFNRISRQSRTSFPLIKIEEADNSRSLVTQSKSNNVAVPARYAGLLNTVI